MGQPGRREPAGAVLRRRPPACATGIRARARSSGSVVAGAGRLADVPAVHGDLQRRRRDQQSGRHEPVAHETSRRRAARSTRRAGGRPWSGAARGRRPDRGATSTGTRTAPPAASRNASRPSSMWASRSARLHPAQGEGPAAVRSDRGQGHPGVAQGPLEQLQCVVVGPADGPASPLLGAGGRRVGGELGGQPELLEQTPSRRTPSRAGPGRRRGRAPAGGTA